MRVTHHGEVTAIHLTTARSWLVGYGVRVFVTRGTLIDTGFHAVRAEVGALLDELRPAGVLLTHQHEDHAGNVELVARRGIPIGASAETLAAVRRVEPIGFYRRFVWSSMVPLRSAVTPYAAGQLELVPAPGHSSDHHVVWDGERETLFSADLYLSVKVRVARPGEDPRRLARSLRAIAALRPTLMFDSHRGRIERPVEALLAKADWLEETVGRIEALALAGWSHRAIRDSVLGRERAVSYISLGELSRMTFVKAVLGASDPGQQ